MNRVSVIQKFIIIASRIKSITFLKIVDRHNSNKFSAVIRYYYNGTAPIFLPVADGKNSN